jgi:chromosomal replication initiation ATPase DnaA
MTGRGGHGEGAAVKENVMPIPTQTLTEDIARARLAQSAAAYMFGVPQSEVEAPTRRSRDACLARQVAMYLTHVAFELPLGRVALAFGRDRSTAAHACHLIEDRRDDARFDACLEALEESLRTAPRLCDGEGR